MHVLSLTVSLYANSGGHYQSADAAHAKHAAAPVLQDTPDSKWV